MPMDPNSPTDRNNYILADSNSLFLITNDVYGKNIDKVSIKKVFVEEVINNFTYRIEDEKSLFLKSIHEKCVKDGVLKEEIKKFTKNL